MHTSLCDTLGIEFPIFAFTHCRDVVVAVSKAGGFGVLGAVGFTPEQLEVELNWIDEHIGGHTYGVDIVIPNKYEGMDSNLSADELAKMLVDMVPQEHLDFAKKILTDHGVPLTAEDNESTLQLLGWTEATATPQVEVALKHPKMTLIANALGTPPKDMIDHIHAEGRKVAALCGSPSQARKHADYGVDIVIPGKYEGMDDMDPEHLAAELRAMVPKEHVEFADKILADHGVPELPPEENERMRLLGWTAATAMPQIEVALAHPKVRLIANALGTPPQDVIDHIHEAGLKVAALCGSPYQALKHRDAGVDIVIAQGGEAGGHSGEIGSIVLWPQVVKEVAPVPVLAAGGIGSGQQIAAALALGAQGAWTGSQWLMVEEAENTPVQQAAYVKAGSRDTVRSRSFTGKPARMLKNDWTEAWENPDNPKPLGMPLQFMVSGLAVAATHKYPDETVDVAFNPVGQVVGQFEKVEKTSAVIERWVQEYLEATNTLNELNEAASV
jgi:NAD(P)H-dependent flavin oxidoreductase YrpB (nitropropane dioxygenase family)